MAAHKHSIGRDDLWLFTVDLSILICDRERTDNMQTFPTVKSF